MSKKIEKIRKNYEIKNSEKLQNSRKIKKIQGNLEN